MSQNRSHDVHLRMGRSSVAPRRVDLFERHRCLPEGRSCPSILCWNEHGQDTSMLQRFNKRRWVLGPTHEYHAVMVCGAQTTVRSQQNEVLRVVG